MYLETVSAPELICRKKINLSVPLGSYIIMRWEEEFGSHGSLNMDLSRTEVLLLPCRFILEKISLCSPLLPVLPCSNTFPSCSPFIKIK